MKIAIIGSGNIATFFGLRLKKAGFKIIQVVSSTLVHAQTLALKLDCEYNNTILKLTPNADAYLFAVKDDVLLDLAKTVRLPHKLIIHTAGSIQLHELNSISSLTACMWSLYSIQKDHLPESTIIPLILNYSDQSIKTDIYKIAQCISHNIVELDDHQKSTAHLAAVFANNFTNHLLTLSHQLLEKEHIPFEIMLPIIQNTIEKLSTSSPFQNQSGPAIRHDEKTIHKHLELLKENPLLVQIYQLLTMSIQSNH